MKLRTLAASIVSAAVVLAPSVAHACARDEVIHQEPGTWSPAIALQSAETLLEKGSDVDLAEAIRLTTATRAEVERDPGAASLVAATVDGWSPEKTRAAGKRLAARATMLEQLGRSRLASATPSEREYAATRIEQLRAENEGLVPDTTYAEVLARVPAREETAYGMLQELERKDLLGSAWEHATLARVAAKHGDERRATAAELRCRDLAVDAAICSPSAPRSRAGLAYGGGGAGLGLAAMARVLVRRRRARRVDEPTSAT